MTIKEEILERAGVLYEMAAKHLIPVIKLIKDGDIEAAVEKYREAGGVPGGVTRTVNHYLTNNPDVDDENFKKFMAAFSQIRATEGKDKPKREYKSSKTGTTKEGEAIEAGGQSAFARNKRLKKKLEKDLEKAKKELKMVDDGTEEQLKKLAKTIIQDISDEPDKEDKMNIEILKDYIGGEGNDEEAKSAMRDNIKNGMYNIAAIYEVVNQYEKIRPTEDQIDKLEKRYKKIEAAKKAKEAK
jgi:hypothetical protein